MQTPLEAFIKDCKENVQLLKEKNPYVDYVAFKVTGVPRNDIKAIANKHNEPVSTINDTVIVKIPMEDMYLTITS